MHPQLYLKTFWRLELKPTIFVAMSFADRYKARFEEVIEPAINSIEVNGKALKADRVDISKSGDSILTDIMDCIAHSQMVLADVSSIGKDSVTGEPFRNGNVMYEVGLALACRHSSEVLLVRDDDDKFLFDVSTIPHKRIDFTNKEKAVTELHAELLARLKERNHINDARVQLAIAGLSGDEVTALKYMADLPPGTVWGRADKGIVDFHAMASIPRLLDKQLIKVVGEFEDGPPAYHPTPLGHTVAQLVKSGLRKFKADAKENKKQEENV
jgi:hypothetical protein